MSFSILNPKKTMTSFNRRCMSKNIHMISNIFSQDLGLKGALCPSLPLSASPSLCGTADLLQGCGVLRADHRLLGGLLVCQSFEWLIYSRV